MGHESSGDATTGDLGLLNNSYINGVQKRSTYIHTQLLAKYFPAYANFRMGSCSTSVPIKVFSASDCGQIAVMICNEDNSSYSIDMSFGTSYAGTNTKLKLNIGNAPMFSFNIGANETRVYRFDPCGKPYVDYYVYNSTNNQSYSSYSTLNNPSYTRYCRCVKFSSPAYPSNSTLRCASPTETGTVHYNSYTVSSTFSIRDSAYITGTLVIPSGYTLTLDNAEVSMGSGAKIQVNNGGKLEVLNSRLYACEGDSWDGIDVTGPSIINSVYIDQSYISDAVTALKTHATNSISITSTVFKNNTTAIELNSSKYFDVSENEFIDCAYGVVTNSTDPGASYIQENMFYNPTNAIESHDDNHTYLDVTCNGFIEYSDYAIYADASDFKDQGSTTNGAGNYFQTGSSLTNHQLRYNGTAITYYTDRSQTFTLSLGGYSATATTASSDGVCNDRSGARPAGIKETNANEITLTCYPNPASDKVTFVCKAQPGVTTQVEITDVYGRKLMSAQLANDSAIKEQDISTWPAGIYFCSLKVNGKYSGTSKLIVSH